MRVHSSQAVVVENPAALGTTLQFGATSPPGVCAMPVVSAALCSSAQLLLALSQHQVTKCDLVSTFVSLSLVAPCGGVASYGVQGPKSALSIRQLTRQAVWHYVSGMEACHIPNAKMSSLAGNPLRASSEAVLRRSHVIIPISARNNPSQVFVSPK